MQFFEDQHGSLLPTSDIKRVYRQDGGKSADWYAELENGNSHRLAEGEYENLRRAGASFAAATAEHFVLSVDFEAERNDPVFRIPIVGWLNCPELGPVPMTLEGVNNGEREAPPVLFPNGQVHHPFMGLFDTIDEFLEQKRKEN
jgi:hypothetical protein